MEKSKANLDKKGFSLEKRMKEKISAIASIEDDLPSVIIVHNLRTRSVEYMSKRGLKILNTSIKELKNLGPDYFQKYFNPQDAPNYVPKFLAMLEKNNLEVVFSYFQQVRSSEIEEWGWYLSSSKVLMLDDEGFPLLSITAAHPIDELKSITYKLERLIDETELMRKNLCKFACLTRREKEIMKLLVAGHSSAVIAEMLFVAPSTIEQHRKNIKSKTGIKTIPDLVKFAQAFDLA